MEVQTHCSKTLIDEKIVNHNPYISNSSHLCVISNNILGLMMAHRESEECPYWAYKSGIGNSYFMMWTLSSLSLIIWQISRSTGPTPLSSFSFCQTKCLHTCEFSGLFQKLQKGNSTVTDVTFVALPANKFHCTHYQILTLAWCCRGIIYWDLHLSDNMWT